MAALTYIWHFIWTVAGVNNYCDISRLNICNTNPSLSSSVYDLPILLVITYHMVEWLRSCLYLTSILTASNMIRFYYFLSINSLYGFIVIIYALNRRFDHNGEECAVVQSERARYLSM